MEINDKLRGFTVTNIRDIRETGGRLIEMEHDVTGAKLLWCDNGDENKLFSVGFRTLPEDNTGVFHILEHSVLCGSDRYPVKEPFVELLKTSMNTFLNAMTYPDKTLYPVSSRIDQDYLNLTGVYLDAVFRPAILNDPNIFYQEGRHIDTTGDEPVYKGVVFNEMKGAMSDVDQVADRTMTKLLFPDTCYGYNSGGDPEAIPDLTYESYIERYKKFYHPSNAYFYLDGAVPLDETLSMIEDYLKDYDRLEDIPQIDMQEPAVTSSVITYDASAEDDKPMVCFGRIIGDYTDIGKTYALSIILEQLSDTNESPLKRAVLSSGLAEDVEIYVNDGILQPYLMLLFRGVKETDGSAEASADRLLAIVKETIDRCVSEGFSKRSLEASVNQMDFRFRQYPEPQALYRANAAFASWLYGGDPALYLKTDEAIASLRKMIEDGGIEPVAKELMGDVSAYTRLILKPDTEHAARAAAKEAARVKDTLDAMTDEEREELEELNRRLLEWQQTEDSEEDLAKIPQLDLADIKSEPEYYPTEEKDAGGVKLLYHQIETHGIIYINAYFPVTQLGIEDLPKAALITEFYKELPTQNYSVLQLQEELKMYVGSMSFGLDILAADDDRSACTPCLRARVSVLPENLDRAEDLLMEIMTRTRFDDKTLLRELITQIDDDVKRLAVSSGHRLALTEARAHWSARDAASEAVNGYSFMQYMHKMAAASDEDLEGFCSFAGSVIKDSITKNNSILSETADSYAGLDHLVSMLADGPAMPERAAYKTSLPKEMGIVIPASVSFAVTSYDVSADGFGMTGGMAVTSNIISLAYLWNVIRVQGGAYGASMSAGRTGSIFCYTYRDPSPERSLGIHKTVADFIDSFASEDANIDGFIISTIANTEPLISPAAKGRAADDFYLSGFSYDDRLRFRREILSAKPSDLAAQKDALVKMAERGTVCVVGPKDAVESCGIAEIMSL
ncbi:MAG: insulinase family protein [Mogibacterium sp.]|nr:insulinase family protein [Mogibacterium sp.]